MELISAPSRPGWDVGNIKSTMVFLKGVHFKDALTDALTKVKCRLAGGICESIADRSSLILGV